MLFFSFLFSDEAAALMALPGAEHRLELTQADMLDYGSLVEVCMGCDGVFHTSSPSDLVSNYPVSLQLTAFKQLFVLQFMHLFALKNETEVEQEYQQVIVFQLGRNLT